MELVLAREGIARRDFLLTKDVLGKVIHKIIEVAIYIGFGFVYNRGRIRIVLHIASFRGDIRIFPR